MQRFVLTYFPCRGRQETAQLLMEYAGLGYKTTPVALATWKQDKEKFFEITPFGQLPVLEDKEAGFTMCQSQAVYRYLAEIGGMNGRNALERARTDEFAETIADINQKLLGITWDAKEYADLPSHRQKCRDQLSLLQGYFRRVRADPLHWIAKDYVSLADVRAAVFFEALLPLHEGLLSEEFPEFYAFNEHFYALPRIKEYVQSNRRFRTWTVPMAVWAGKENETKQRTIE
jgi:glutathione S-transferase